MKKRHFSQNIEGALKNWSKQDWLCMARDNKCTVEEVKDYFWQCLNEGKRVLPMAGHCEGFSYQTGCPGHDILKPLEECR